MTPITASEAKVMYIKKVRKLHKRAREMQKKADTEAVGMYSKMIAADEADTAGAAGG